MIPAGPNWDTFRASLSNKNVIPVGGNYLVYISGLGRDINGEEILPADKKLLYPQTISVKEGTFIDNIISYQYNQMYTIPVGYISPATISLTFILTYDLNKPDEHDLYNLFQRSMTRIVGRKPFDSYFSTDGADFIKIWTGDVAAAPDAIFAQKGPVLGQWYRPRVIAMSEIELAALDKPVSFFTVVLSANRNDQTLGYRNDLNLL